jgi:hypothetical protein
MNRICRVCQVVVCVSVMSLGCKPPPPSQGSGSQPGMQSGQAGAAPAGMLQAADEPFTPFNGMTGIWPGHRLIFRIERDRPFIAQVVENRGNNLFMVRLAGWPADMVQPCRPTQFQSISEEYSVAKLPTSKIEQVEFERNGKWICGTVVSRKGDQCTVHINGDRMADDVVVSQSKIRKPPELNLGPEESFEPRICLVGKSWGQTSARRGKLFRTRFLANKDYPEAWMTEARIQFEPRGEKEAAAFQMAADFAAGKFYPGQEVSMTTVDRFVYRGRVLEVGEGKCRVRFTSKTYGDEDRWVANSRIEGKPPPVP